MPNTLRLERQSDETRKAAPEPSARWKAWRAGHRRDAMFFLVGLFVTAVAAIAQHRLTSQGLEYQQATFTVTEIVAKWNDNTSPFKDTIEEQFPGLYNDENFALMTEERARRLYATTQEDPRLYEVRQGVVALLNYFDFIGLASEHGIADEALVHDFAGGPLKRWFTALTPFIRIYNLRRGGCVWGAYYRLLERLDLDVTAIMWPDENGDHGRSCANLASVLRELDSGQPPLSPAPLTSSLP